MLLLSNLWCISDCQFCRLILQSLFSYVICLALLCCLKFIVTVLNTFMYTQITASFFYNHSYTISLSSFQDRWLRRDLERDPCKKVRYGDKRQKYWWEVWSATHKIKCSGCRLEHMLAACLRRDLEMSTTESLLANCNSLLYFMSSHGTKIGSNCCVS